MKKEKYALISTLNKKPNIIFAYLFGSKVKGYASERSDWDVAVYFRDPVEKNGLWPGFELEAELSREVEGTVQVVILNAPLSPVFGFEIVKYGKVLLDRDSDLRMEFENRVLRQYYDWQYFLKRQMESER